MLFYKPWPPAAPRVVPGMAGRSSEASHSPRTVTLERASTWWKYLHAEEGPLVPGSDSPCSAGLLAVSLGRASSLPRTSLLSPVRGRRLSCRGRICCCLLGYYQLSLKQHAFILSFLGVGGSVRGLAESSRTRSLMRPNQGVGWGLIWRPDWGRVCSQAPVLAGSSFLQVVGPAASVPCCGREAALDQSPLVSLSKEMQAGSGSGGKQRTLSHSYQAVSRATG